MRRDYHTPTRQTFLKRIQRRINEDTWDIIIAAACGICLGVMFAAFI